jgi:pimeloyl-ACP methyl ester carboxylesterase
MNGIEKGTLITIDGEKISYNFYKNKHRQLVIIAPGFYNSKDSVLIEKLAEILKDEYDVFTFDFRGHGRSSGVFTWTSKEKNDLSAVLDYLEGKYDKVAMIAFSLAAVVSMNVLSKRGGVDSFVCVSALSDLCKIDYNFWRLDWENDIFYTLLSKEGRKGKGIRIGPFWLKKEKPLNNVDKIGAAILYIHGDKDWVVKSWHSRLLYEKTNSPKRLVIIKDGPHAEYLLRKFHDEFVAEIKNWLKETL